MYSCLRTTTCFVILLASFFSVPTAVVAAVAFDAFNAGTSGTGNLSYTHTPVGTPKGIVVMVSQIGSKADQVSSVTYGGVAMTEVAGSPNILATGEVDVVYTYFLGSSIPTGAQTVSVTVSGAANKLANSYSLTALTDTEIVDVDATINSAAQENPSVTLSLGGRTSWASINLLSGQNDITGITPLAGWTSNGETDGGLVTLGTYRYNTIGTADITAGWTQTSDDALAITLAVSEVQAQGGGDTPVPSRVMRLFEGFQIKLLNGRVILHQTR